MGIESIFHKSNSMSFDCLMNSINFSNQLESRLLLVGMQNTPYSQNKMTHVYVVFSEIFKRRQLWIEVQIL